MVGSAGHSRLEQRVYTAPILPDAIALEYIYVRLGAVARYCHFLYHFCRVFFVAVSTRMQRPGGCQSVTIPAPGSGGYSVDLVH